MEKKEANEEVRLILDAGTLHQYKLENGASFGQSVFNEAYARAMDVVNEIVDSSRMYSEAADTVNNIIAFVGERGTGKTSVMRSFAQALQDDGLTVDGEGFHHLSTIDPAAMAKDSMLELVLAAMLSEWRRRYRDGQLHSEADKIQTELLEKFGLVYRGTGILRRKDNESNWENQTISDLSASAEAFQLKRNLKCLIELYLKAINGSEKGQFLIICIDDIDTYEADGVKMLEEVRKYLTLPHVVVLMTLNLQQMRFMIRDKLVSKFESSVNLSRVYISSDYKVKTERWSIRNIDVFLSQYLEKVIPYNHRIHMPDLQADGYSVRAFFSKDNEQNRSELAEKSLRKFLVALIANNTGYCICTDANWEAVLPRSLRGLVEMTWSLMQPFDVNIRKSKQNGDVAVKSKALLHYFRETIEFYNYALPEKSDIFTDIMRADIDKVNVIVLNKICSDLQVSNFTKQIRTRWKELLDIIFYRRKHICSEKVKVIDVITLLHIALEVSDKETNFIWQKVKTAYSIRLLDVQNDSVMRKLYNNDMAGLYFYGSGNSLFDRIYRSIYTDDQSTIEAMSEILERVHQPLIGKDSYIPGFFNEEADLEINIPVYRLSPMRLPLKFVLNNIQGFLCNLDVYMMWLDKVEIESLSLLKQKDEKLDDVEWCLMTIYEAVKGATEKMKRDVDFTKEIKTALTKCEKELQSQATKFVEKYTFETEFRLIRGSDEKGIFFKVKNKV